MCGKKLPHSPAGWKWNTKLKGNNQQHENKYLLVEIEDHPLVGVSAAGITRKVLNPSIARRRQTVRYDRSVCGGCKRDRMKTVRINGKKGMKRCRGQERNSPAHLHSNAHYLKHAHNKITTRTDHLHRKKRTWPSRASSWEWSNWSDCRCTHPDWSRSPRGWRCCRVSRKSRQC